MKPIRILTPELDLQGEIDNYLSFSYLRKFHTYGEFQLVTNKKIQNAEKLNINNLIMLGADRHKTGIIRHKEIKTGEQGEEILTVRGYTLGVIVGQRITIPPDGLAYDIQESSGEAVMKHYVRRNCLDIPGMEFSNFAIAPNQNRGENIKWQSRYKNLVEELERLSGLTNLGWQIYLDFDSKMWIFDIYNGRDFSVSQDINPPVIFSPQFENVKSQELTESLIGYGNYAIVAGQGEGADREVIMLGDKAIGLDKHVIFADARDIENPIDLPARGELKLSEHQRIISFQSEILTHGPFLYEKDWDLGDIVTVQNKDWGLTINAQITEVEEIYEAAGFKLDVTFGSCLPTLSEKIKKELDRPLIEKGIPLDGGPGSGEKGLPSGGNKGDVLLKRSVTDYDYGWGKIKTIPYLETFDRDLFGLPEGWGIIYGKKEWECTTFEGRSVLKYYSGESNRNAICWLAHGIFEDVEVYGEVYANKPNLGLIVRASGSADVESGYVAQTRSDGHRIAKYNNGTFTALGSQTTGYIPPINSWFNIRLCCQGNQIKYKMWNKGQTEPGWVNEETDNTLTRGYVGIFSFVADAIIYFSNFEITPL